MCILLPRTQKFYVSLVHHHHHDFNHDRHSKMSNKINVRFEFQEKKKFVASGMLTMNPLAYIEEIRASIRQSLLLRNVIGDHDELRLEYGDGCLIELEDDLMGEHITEKGKMTFTDASEFYVTRFTSMLVLAHH